MGADLTAYAGSYGLGRPRETALRDRARLRSCSMRGPGCSGDCMPKDFPFTTDARYFLRPGEIDGCLRRSIECSSACKRAKRRVGNRAGRRGSSTVIGKDDRGLAAAGYDAAKRSKGRRRQL